MFHGDVVARWRRLKKATTRLPYRRYCCSTYLRRRASCATPIVVVGSQFRSTSSRTRLKKICYKTELPLYYREHQVLPLQSEYPVCTEFTSETDLFGGVSGFPRGVKSPLKKRQQLQRRPPRDSGDDAVVGVGVAMVGRTRAAREYCVTTTATSHQPLLHTARRPCCS